MERITDPKAAKRLIDSQFGLVSGKPSIEGMSDQRALNIVNSDWWKEEIGQVQREQRPMTGFKSTS